MVGEGNREPGSVSEGETPLDGQGCSLPGREMFVKAWRACGSPGM